MDRIVERLVRQVVAARRTGNDATQLMLMGRLTAMAGQPGFMRSFDRALTIVNWR